VTITAPSYGTVCHQ